MGNEEINQLPRTRLEAAIRILAIFITYIIFLVPLIFWRQMPIMAVCMNLTWLFLLTIWSMIAEVKEEVLVASALYGAVMGLLVSYIMAGMAKI